MALRGRGSALGIHRELDPEAPAARHHEPDPGELRAFGVKDLNNTVRYLPFNLISY